MNGWNQFEDLDLSHSDGLTSLGELGDFPTLRCLNLESCRHLKQLPNLSKSTNLHSLILSGCSALRVYEEDIEMLDGLPLLEYLSFKDKDKDDDEDEDEEKDEEEDEDEDKHEDEEAKNVDEE